MESLGTSDALHDLAGVVFDEMRVKIGYLPGAARTPRHEKIVRALIEFAHSLDLIAVAEGVHDEAVADRLMELGCDHALGTHFGVPLDAAAFISTYEGNVGTADRGSGASSIFPMSRLLFPVASRPEKEAENVLTTKSTALTVSRRRDACASARRAPARRCRLTPPASPQ
jgi:hypothetical protein